MTMLPPYKPTINATTRIGTARDAYSAEDEGRPPTFLRDGDGWASNPAYGEWAARADAWAAERSQA